ncbi:hypothetical protein LTR56_020091 [Elasticomyces elasticus]|nr:hypothetical protein LTR56_020091 [Elasticomyces elasticus]KAK3633854.1 hypothetical protein LTR22_019929 [Elasticomyces elasticus]KAK4910962.1 hypothetical protein LTR49_020407 [Elasticomyces elasticus]
MTRRLPTTTTSPHTTTTTPSNGSSGAPLDAAMSRTHLNQSPSIFTYNHTASTAHGTTGLWQPKELSNRGKHPTSQASILNPQKTIVSQGAWQRRYLATPCAQKGTPCGSSTAARFHTSLKTSVSPHTNLETGDTATPPSHRTAEQGLFHPNDPFFERAPVEYPAGSWPGATRVDDSAKRFPRTESRSANPPHPQPTNEERLTNLENVVEEQHTRLIWYQIKLDRLSTPRISSAAALRRSKHIPPDTSPPKDPSPPAPNAESKNATTTAAQPPTIDVNVKLELMTQQFQRYHDPPRAGKGVSSNPTHGAAATPNGPNTPALIAAAATPSSPADVNAKLELLTSHIHICLLTAMPLLITLAYKPLLVWTPEYGGLVFLWLVAVLKPEPGASRGILGRFSN